MNHAGHPTAVIVADSHFHLDPDAAERRRLERFLALLETARRADHLILLGDIFDFWFDYPHFRLKGYEPLLAALDAVRAADTRIHFIGGNHDVWAAAYMRDRYGCPIRGEADVTDLDGLRVRLSHGDGLIKLDWAYNGFRAAVRNRAGIVLAKMLHPEVLYGLCRWLSGHSRSASRDEAATIETRAATWLRRQGDVDWDLMVMGHVHHGFEVRDGAKRLVALPGWLDRLGYGLLRDGDFRVFDIDRDGLPLL